MQSYMTIFGQEGLGRPDLEAAGQCDAVTKYLEKQLDGAQVPPVGTVLVFTNDQVDIQVEDAPLPAVPLKKLKDFMRQKIKESPSAAATMQQRARVLSRRSEGKPRASGRPPVWEWP